MWSGCTLHRTMTSPIFQRSLKPSKRMLKQEKTHQSDGGKRELERLSLKHIPKWGWEDISYNKRGYL
ncbi:hypothetical protein AAFF_G00077830 [Aldrovandia affinis]|uniref:Uncharacterized protein n=1 Tax=Aldrovandia affinis TaxID=143900 RepID=A0AAD7RXQ6_9TELE|nr:hypothetical protein AAFF_G00077830 [Aldrovandia affinis]